MRSICVGDKVRPVCPGLLQLTQACKQGELLLLLGVAHALNGLRLVSQLLLHVRPSSRGVDALLICSNFEKVGDVLFRLNKALVEGFLSFDIL